jgi:hypothetical protein
MQFFSEVDMARNTATGQLEVKAEYPSWYNPRNLQVLEDEVAQMEYAIENGQVPRGYEPEYRDNLAQKKAHLNKVKDMTFVEDAKTSNAKLGDVIGEVGKVLRNELPSKKDMDDNLVDAHMEYQKMTTPYITIKDSAAMCELAKACNVQIVDGKVSREGMAKMWKIGTKKLGGYANVETLRKR